MKNISYNADEDDVKDFFEYCDNIINVKLLTREDGKSKGTAFIKFSKRSSFNHALALNGTAYLGKSLKI